MPHDIEIDLGSVDAARDFYVGMPIWMTANAARWWNLRWWRLGRLALHCTRWFRFRAVVVAVDLRAARITVGRQRWSWRRRRWDRVASPWPIRARWMEVS